MMMIIIIIIITIGILGLVRQNIRYSAFIFFNSVFTTKCDFIVLSQVNEMPLTVNKFN